MDYSVTARNGCTSKGRWALWGSNSCPSRGQHRLQIDKTYKEWLQREFDKRGWKLEHQAPQGPYTNVLDLQMFIAMSKRHSKLLQMYSNNEANTERIWKVAQQVWKSCFSSMVCSL
jgi:hypothetical protein